MKKIVTLTAAATLFVMMSAAAAGAEKTDVDQLNPASELLQSTTTISLQNKSDNNTNVTESQTTDEEAIPTVEGKVVSVDKDENANAENESNKLRPLLNIDEPLIQAKDTVIAPDPIELFTVEWIYDNPDGKKLNALAPQFVHPTGKTLGDWVEIYTWLGKAWIVIPNYEHSYGTNS